jgi:hypothetical protein
MIKINYIIIIVFATAHYHCAIHNASTLIKDLQCEHIDEVSISFADSIKYKYFYTSRTKVRYSILLSNKDSSLIKQKIEFCHLIDILKRVKYYQKKQEINTIQSQKDSISALYIRIERKNDWMSIDLETGGIYFHNDKKRLEIGRDIPLIYYASNSFYKRSILSKELILYANKMIIYRNEKVKNDSSLSDSLRQVYPLINN